MLNDVFPAFMLISFLFYLLGLIIILFIIKTHLLKKNSEKPNYTNTKIPGQVIRILLIIFSILFVSNYYGLYQAMSLALQFSSIEMIVVSVIFGGLIYFSIYQVILKLNKSKIFKNLKTARPKYEILIVIIFLLFTLFSAQSYTLISNKSSSLSNPSVDINYSSELNKVAYIVNIGPNPDQFLVVKSLNSSYSSTTNLCYQIQCPKHFFAPHIYFYNSNYLLIMAKHLFQNFPNYIFNLTSKQLLQIPAQISYLNKEIRINKTLYINWIANKMLANGTNTNQLQLVLYNVIKNETITINIPGFREYSEMIPNFYLSSDLSTFSAIVNQTTLAVYTLHNLNLTLQNAQSLNNTENFRYINSNDPQMIYYSLENPTTELFSYNISTKKSNLEAKLSTKENIAFVNSKESYFGTTEFVHIYSFKDNKLQILQNTTMQSVYWNNDGSYFVSYNSKYLFLNRYDSITNSFSQIKIIDTFVSIDEVNLFNTIASNFSILTVGLVIITILDFFLNIRYVQDYNKSDFNVSNKAETTKLDLGNSMLYSLHRDKLKK